MGRSTASVPTDDDLIACDNFSLVLGGPLFQLFCKAHLSNDALAMLHRRILVISLIVWLPLLVLSAVGGRLVGGHVAVPFLVDFEVHARFLVAIPLLIGAELVVNQQIRIVISQFLERELIPDNAKAQFRAAITSSIRLRNSVVAEVLLIAFVYGVGIMAIWRHYLALDALTWYATPAPGGVKLSVAGVWYVFVSLPFFQFLLCRWYFRLAIWARFLWQVSRIKLNLLPADPDKNAGLGFLANVSSAFALLVVAHGVLLSGLMANRIFFLGARLADFKMEIAALVIFMLCIVFGPLLVFMPQLAKSKRTGRIEYGILAHHYVRIFDRKWLRGSAPADEILIGSSDIQSLADLSNSVAVVRTMSILPITREAILLLVVEALGPIVPLIFTMMPLEEIMKILLGIVL